MAAAFLPPMTYSPFGKGFGSKSYALSSVDSNHAMASERWHHNKPLNLPVQHRVSSLPTPVLYDGSISNGDENLETKLHPTRSPSSSKKRPRSIATESFPVFEDLRLSSDSQFGCVKRAKGEYRSSSQSWTGTQPTIDYNQYMAQSPPREMGASISLDDGTQGLRSAIPPALSENPLERTAQNFKRWADTLRGRRGQQLSEGVTSAINPSVSTDVVASLRGLPLQSTRHRKRTSNASSRFITTVKTASFSNDSMSVLPRRQLQSPWSDHRLARSSEPRSSIESRRTSSVFSLSDDVAPRRAIKRRQILHEILNTEEQYVLDLKALHNLFSTLLATIPSVSVQVRTSIQRNVTEMLHLHEQIVNDLHRIRLRAALRNWNFQPPSARRESKRRRKWQSLDIPLSQALAAKFRRRPMSPNTQALGNSNCPEHFADPIEAADIAMVFREHISRFSVYEEYCAKYEMMVHEIANSNKMIPQWQVYEAGIEALANSVTALNQRHEEGKKGLTAADLLIKPVQRMCRYPLLFADLHKHTPVIDCPKSHAEVDRTLNIFRQVVGEINAVRDDPRVREHVQRRWLLQERLIFGRSSPTSAKLRQMGHVVLCGVLHIAYRTNTRVEGRYMMSVMFQDFFLVAAPAEQQGKFDVVAMVYLADADIVSTEDGRGLQCYNALFSWKVVFESDGLLLELLVSACSGTEQQQWLSAFERGRSLLALEGSQPHPYAAKLCTSTYLDLKPLGPVFRQGGPLARRLSIQRAATVGTRIPICPVIIKNTHKPQDGQESKPTPLVHAINRSQSLLTTHRTTVLAPKRSDRVRLEHSLADIWTRETLPYPGMSLVRGGSMIRASAGSLVRKLSLASIHAPFTRRSPSLNIVGPHQNQERRSDGKREHVEYVHEMFNEPLRHEVLLDDISDDIAGENEGIDDKDLAATAQPDINRHATTARKYLRRFDSKIGRGSSIRLSRRLSKTSIVERPLDRECSILSSVLEQEMVEDKLSGGRKRWSNPFGVLKTLSSDGVRHLLYSSK